MTMIKNTVWLYALITFVCGSINGMEKFTQKHVKFVAGAVATQTQNNKYIRLNTRTTRPVNMARVGNTNTYFSEGEYNKMEAVLKNTSPVPMPACCVIL